MVVFNPSTTPVGGEEQVQLTALVAGEVLPATQQEPPLAAPVLTHHVPGTEKNSLRRISSMAREACWRT